MSARTAFILGLSSDLGRALAERFLRAGFKVVGTYRSSNAGLERCVTLKVDLLDGDAAERIARFVESEGVRWDVFISSIGELAPVGPFFETEPAAWERSFALNSSAQLGALHALYPFRAVGRVCHAVFFAGGGVNGPFRNYSAYCLGKIALIKMCELLADEAPDLNTFISGTGWVRTKIHRTTLAAGTRAGANLERTKHFLATEGTGTSFDEIFDHILWAIEVGPEVTSGRNFSIVHDAWRASDGTLADELRGDPHRFRLRRREELLPNTAGLRALVDLLPHLHDKHSPANPEMVALDRLARSLVSDIRCHAANRRPMDFGPWGPILLPDPVHVRTRAGGGCLALRELVAFSFYWRSRLHYTDALATGEDHGVHAMIMSRCGLSVSTDTDAPDLTRTTPQAPAQDGSAAMALTTVPNAKAGAAGSWLVEHLDGAPDLLICATMAREKHLLARVELTAVMRDIILKTPLADWRRIDMFVSINTREDARAILDRFHGSPVRLFSQRVDWKPAQSIEAMPWSSEHGYLFISRRLNMPWTPPP